jgi:hypothetical protein
MNLLDMVIMSAVIVVDDISVGGFKRRSNSGIPTDIANNTTKASPPRHVQRHVQVEGDEHLSFLFLRIIADEY